MQLKQFNKNTGQWEPILFTEKGDPGPTTSIKIGTVSTGNAGTNASASIVGAAPDLSLNLTIPRGDKGDTGNTNANELTGVGSPYGTVTPPSAGVYYTDKNGTNGAWRWIATGTTSNSWVVIFGDTGWRDLYDDVIAMNLAPASWILPGDLTIRRVNETVHVAFEKQWAGGPTIAVTPWVQMAPIPVGFEPHVPKSQYRRSGGYSVQGANGQTPQLQNVWFGPSWDNGDGRYRHFYIRADVAANVTALTDYVTNSPWPKTLPGTAAVI